MKPFDVRVIDYVNSRDIINIKAAPGMIFNDDMIKVLWE